MDEPLSKIAGKYLLQTLTFRIGTAIPRFESITQVSRTGINSDSGQIRFPKPENF